MRSGFILDRVILVIIRDFYFGAWLIKAHGYSYQISGGKVDIDIDKSTLADFSRDYCENHKEYFDCVKQLIREANQSRVMAICLN